MLLWVDETGFDNGNLLRKFGDGIRGQSPQDHTLMLRGKHYLAVAVLSNERIEDVYITDNHVNGELFLEFIHRCTQPIVMLFDGTNPNSVVIMDNVSIQCSGKTSYKCWSTSKVPPSIFSRHQSNRRSFCRSEALFTSKQYFI